jgi:hypothetical protein
LEGAVRFEEAVSDYDHLPELEDEDWDERKNLTEEDISKMVNITHLSCVCADESTFVDQKEVITQLFSMIHSFVIMMKASFVIMMKKTFLTALIA